MSGIQVHPHDILDEGPEQMLDLIEKMKEITYIFPQVNTIFERNPYPFGELPHNPVNTVVQGKGTFHLNIDTKSLSPNLYQPVDETIVAGAKPLQQLVNAVGDKHEIVPWLNILNGLFQGDYLQRNNVIDYQGNRVDHWLCPNGPDVIPMWSRIITEIVKETGFDFFMIDRIRYPDWSGEEVSPRNVFSCFCNHCRINMQIAGIEVEELIEEINELVQTMHEKEFSKTLEAYERSKWMRPWIAFRQNSVSGFIEDLINYLKKDGQNVRFWLDLWPPSYAWFLGQDYTRLTKLSPILKHFPYHKLGGGADVQGLINYFTNDPAQQEELFQVFLTFFHLDYSITYEEFKNNGYPLSFIKNENNLVRKISQPETKIYSGIQMWNTTNAELVKAVTEARDSAADEMLYYCYGWAERSFFESIGNMSK